MFEWADGGNLREYWKTSHEMLHRSTVMVQDSVTQLLGLAKAIETFHHYNHDNSKNIGCGMMGNVRHGDLKPENILRFKTKKGKLGLLKICDFGIGKQHFLETRLRDGPTDTKFSSRKYEAPEASKKNVKRSRLFDIWSFGCIVLEFIVWMLYGETGLENLHRHVSNGFFIQKGQDLEVHPAVLKCIDHILQHDPACTSKSGTAVSDLLRLVQDKLLVVSLPHEHSEALSDTTSEESFSHSHALKKPNTPMINFQPFKNGRAESQDSFPKVLVRAATKSGADFDVKSRITSAQLTSELEIICRKIKDQGDQYVITGENSELQKLRKQFTEKMEGIDTRNLLTVDDNRFYSKQLPNTGQTKVVIIY